MADSLATQIPLTPDEQRHARRPRVLLTGRLVYGPDWLTLDCVIRDLTPEGARSFKAMAAAHEQWIDTML